MMTIETSKYIPAVTTSPVLTLLASSSIYINDFPNRKNNGKINAS